MITHPLHLPSYLLGIVCILALLWTLASWRWALATTLCCLPWAFAFVLAHAAEPPEVCLLVEVVLAHAERPPPRLPGTPPPNGLCDGRSPDACWL